MKTIEYCGDVQGFDCWATTTKKLNYKKNTNIN